MFGRQGPVGVAVEEVEPPGDLPLELRIVDRRAGRGAAEKDLQAMLWVARGEAEEWRLELGRALDEEADPQARLPSPISL
jgi:hypothetical protein